jgi:hypothetical protein
MSKRLPLASKKEINEYTGKIVKVDCGSYNHERLIKKAVINKVENKKTVNGELIFQVTILCKKYGNHTTLKYESEVI